MTYTAADRRRVVDAIYRRRYTYLRYAGEPTSLIPADQAAAHVQRLYALGWSSKALAEMTDGITDTTVINLLRGRHPTISRSTERAVLRIPITLAPGPNVRPEMLVPTLGATRRVQALMRLGWTHTEMRKRVAGTSHLARSTYRQMSADGWREVAAVFGELSMTLGPSGITRARAAANGYAPPLAWDNLDAPDEQPQGTATPRNGRHASHTEARTADLEHFVGADMSLDEACRELGVKVDALWKWCDRHNRRDLYERLARGHRRSNNQHTARGAA